MNDNVSILICGVGGQGILLASDVLVDVAFEAGLDVKKSEVHGMSQRGGSVVSHVRFGEKVYSPLIRTGEADFLFSFERMETLRYIEYLRPGGLAIVNDQRVNPTYVSLKEAFYPSEIGQYFEGRVRPGGVILVPAIKIAQELGNVRAANVVMLGVLSKFLEFPEELWLRSVEKNVPKKYISVNLHAFRAGRNYKYDVSKPPIEELSHVPVNQQASGHIQSFDPGRGNPRGEGHEPKGSQLENHLRSLTQVSKPIRTFGELFAVVKGLPRRTVVVAGAENEAALGAALEAHARGIADGILIGDEFVIKQKVTQLGSSLEGMEVIHEADEKQIARRSVKLVRQHKGEILLKGRVDTSTLLRAVLDAESGLRTGRLLSDVFLFEYMSDGETRLVMITDGGVILAPDIHQKIEILKNAVDVAHALGMEQPRVAVLSASEVVNPQLISSMDAAVMTEMNRRGEISGCVVEGPLALDLAISPEAARIKGLSSEVAGRADILLVPNIETGNALAKSTTYFAHFPLGHVIVGAAAPILIPSRADAKEAKLHSIALGILMSAYMEAH